MAYEYPDKNDQLTVQLIDTEYDSSYWVESEDFVLSKAIESISALREKDDEKRLLDVGCEKEDCFKYLLLMLIQLQQWNLT